MRAFLLGCGVLTMWAASSALAQVADPRQYQPDLPGVYAPGLIGEGDPLESLASEALGLEAEPGSLTGPRGMPALLEMDLDNDGRVTIAEWRSSMRRGRYPPAMNIALSELDEDGDGIISQAEYARYGEDREILDQLGDGSVVPTPPSAAAPDSPGWNWGIGPGD